MDERKIRVLHINSFDTGGAATALKRIHEGLLRKGVDSKMLLLYKTRDIPESYSFLDTLPKKRPIKENLVLKTSGRVKKELGKWVRLYFYRRQTANIEREKKKLNELISKVEMFSYPTSGLDITEHPLYKDADIIQLNWVSGFLDEPSFFKKNFKPVIWRMPDLYICGGGYHYEKNFLFNELEKEISGNYLIRQNALKNASIALVPISRWVKEKAEESKLVQRFDKHIISNGIDLSLFKPMDRDEARRLFNLPLGKKLILFGAESLGNERKGFNLLLESLNLIDVNAYTFCSFGKSDGSSNFPIINLGAISDERLLCMLYSAADLFVIPSVEEAFGQVTIEALACGIPVVSFATGGSLDIIIDEFNGFIVKDFKSQALAKAIQKALIFPFDKNAIRKDIEVRFNIDSKVDEYINLYKMILCKIGTKGV